MTLNLMSGKKVDVIVSLIIECICDNEEGSVEKNFSQNILITSIDHKF